MCIISEKGSNKIEFGLIPSAGAVDLWGTALLVRNREIFTFLRFYFDVGKGRWRKT